MKRLYGFTLSLSDHIVDLGGGYGDLSSELKSAGFKVRAFIEPDHHKYLVAEKRLGDEVICLNNSISDQIVVEKISKFETLTIVMQDVIEHIPFELQRNFFDDLRCSCRKVVLIGRTPNLKSPFGLRNSFGDNTHIYRFTDASLHDFLAQMGFNSISISAEPYNVTGLVSLARSFPYFLIVSIVSLSFIAVYGSREGWMTPNLVFRAT